MNLRERTLNFSAIMKENGIRSKTLLIFICSQDPGLTLLVSFLNEEKLFLKKGRGSKKKKKKKVESNPLLLFNSVGERGTQSLKTVVLAVQEKVAMGKGASRGTVKTRVAGFWSIGIECTVNLNIKLISCQFVHNKYKSHGMGKKRERPNFIFQGIRMFLSLLCHIVCVLKCCHTSNTNSGSKTSASECGGCFCCKLSLPQYVCLSSYQSVLKIKAEFNAVQKQQDFRVLSEQSKPLQCY